MRGISQWNSRPFISVGLAICLLGCGQVSYKRGGSQMEIDRAHQACRGSGDQLAACLAKQGWQAPQADALDPLFATLSVTDNHTDNLRKPEPFLLPVTPATDRVSQTRSVDTAVAAPNALPANTAPVSAQPATQNTANDGPEVVYAINSWWKLGAFPAQLTQDQRQCEKTLGPDFLPNYATQQFKRAFVSCMHDLGWMAIRTVK